MDQYPRGWGFPALLLVSLSAAIAALSGAAGGWAFAEKQIAPQWGPAASIELEIGQVS
jgi:hypothetical protein